MPSQKEKKIGRKKKKTPKLNNNKSPTHGALSFGILQAQGRRLTSCSQYQLSELAHANCFDYRHLLNTEFQVLPVGHQKFIELTQCQEQQAQKAKRLPRALCFC